MVFEGYNLKTKGSFFRYLFLSVIFHLGILLASRILMLLSPTPPEEEQIVVKLMDIPAQPKRNIPKSNKRRKIAKRPRKALTPKQQQPKPAPPLFSMDRVKPVSPPAILEKPILPGLKRDAQTAKNFLKERQEEVLHFPRITFKEVLPATPKDISRSAVQPGQMTTANRLPPVPRSGQGKEISQLIESDKDRYGFKQPVQVLAIGDSLPESKTPSAGDQYIPLDSKDPNLAPYLAYLKERILQFWRYPAEAQPGLKGQIDLAFIVERDGNVSEIKIIGPSRYSILDEGVLAAVKRAAPFRPIPLDIKEKKLPLLGTFLYNKPTLGRSQPKN